MTTFKYLAKRGPQETIEGVFDAEDRAGVLSHLAALGYTPVRITEADVAQAASAPRPASGRAGTAGRPAGAALRDGRVPTRYLNQFTRQFASLVRSQVPLLRAMGILEDQTAHPRLKGVIRDIAEQIRQGQTLSSALAKYPKTFSGLYISLVRAGEVAGMLDAVLDRLADQADREEALRGKVQAALAYPCFVAVVGVGTVIFLLTFVMPRLISLFHGFGHRLPLPTRILLAMTDGLQQWWVWAGFAIMAAAVVAAVRVRGEVIRLLLDRIGLRVPVLGTLLRQLELGRFARAFGLLLSHGIPILQATEVAIPVVKNRIIRQALGRLPATLKDGGSLSACLKNLSVATPFLVHTVAVGEEGGKAAEALLEVGKYYEREVERLLQTMAALLEPLMILMVGGLVGFIVFAVLLPVFDMSVIAR